MVDDKNSGAEPSRLIIEFTDNAGCGWHREGNVTAEQMLVAAKKLEIFAGMLIQQAFILQAQQGIQCAGLVLPKQNGGLR